VPNKKPKATAANNPRKMTPEEAVIYLDSMSRLGLVKDLPTKAISVRIPENILNLLKLKARAENKKYQSLLIEYVRQGLMNR
jgi:hypothetical protein